jgi:uncharacterized lipoprotein
MLDHQSADNGARIISDVIKNLERNKCSMPSITSTNAKVTAIVKGRKVITDETIKVQFSIDFNRNIATIFIFWEDYGYKRYKSMGLYGMMDTQWQGVEKIDDKTIVVSSEGEYEIDIKMPV